MLDITSIQDTLMKAGLGPTILSLGGYLYAAILLLVLFYYIFLYIIKKLR